MTMRVVIMVEEADAEVEKGSDRYWNNRTRIGLKMLIS